jgi:hypothetical protein
MTISYISIDFGLKLSCREPDLAPYANQAIKMENILTILKVLINLHYISGGGKKGDIPKHFVIN